MRAFASALALSLALSGAVEAAPRRVASLNLCTDELLLMLADPGQVASVTHLSDRPEESVVWRLARRHPRNDGSLLSVAGQRPDLVLTMGGGIRDRAGIARSLGMRVVELPFPTTLDDIESAIRRVSALLGRPGRGERLLARLREARRLAPKRQLETIWLGGNGRSVEAGSLAAQWMALAGYRQRRLKGARVTLEQLLVRPPAILLRSDYRQGQYSGEQRWLGHPIARVAGRSRTVKTDGRRWTCLGPAMIDEVARLRRLSR